MKSLSNQSLKEVSTNTNFTFQSNAFEVEESVSKVIQILHDLDEYPEITQEYIDAISDQDIDKMNWFQSMGKSPRHRINNVNFLRHSLRFGFTEHTFSEYGWLRTKSDWITEEYFSLKVSGDNACHNEFTLVESPNHKWTFGYSLMYGHCSGCGSPCSVFSDPIDSREEALQEVILFIIKEFGAKIASAELRSDDTNYSIPYMNKVLKRLDEINPRSLTKAQLTLF